MERPASSTDDLLSPSTLQIRPGATPAPKPSTREIETIRPVGYPPFLCGKQPLLLSEDSPQGFRWCRCEADSAAIDIFVRALPARGEWTRVWPRTLALSVLMDLRGDSSTRQGGPKPDPPFPSAIGSPLDERPTLHFKGAQDLSRPTTREGIRGSALEGGGGRGRA